MTKRILIGLLILGVTVQVTAAVQTPASRLGLAEPKAEAFLKLPAFDATKLLDEDYQKFSQGEPLHYAKPMALSESQQVDVHQQGEWTKANDGRWIWRLAIEAPGATTLDLGFNQAWLPAGSELYFYDRDRRLVRGPYSDRHNKAHGQLWIPVIPGDRAMLELVVPEKMRPHVRLKLQQVNFGFRFFNQTNQLSKSGACNVDVICPDGDGFRDQIRAAAAYGVGSSSAFCSGQMINNTANNNDPYFLTANHCEIGASEAPSFTVYWNYESENCRMPGSGASGIPLPLSSVEDVQTGASLVADSAMGGGVVGNDFSLLLLDEKPEDSFNVFWTGWNRSGDVQPGATTIHHPQGDEKRISHTELPLMATGYLSETGGGTTHWRVRAWATGTTEPGSSGAGLYDSTGHLIGTLSGGSASCSSDPAMCSGANGSCDWYGRFSESFSAGTTPNRRLSDWLDPTNTGAMIIEGANSCDQPSVVISSSRNPAPAGVTVNFSAQVSGGQAPYTLAWDLDGDGGIDSNDTSVSAAFPDELSGNILLVVTDSADCSATANLGQVVQAPRVEFDSAGTPIERSGDGDANIEPGETWGFPINLRNNGSQDLLNGLAAFSITPASSVSGPTDNFGYSVVDSNTLATACPFDYQDITASGTPLVFSDSDDGSAIQTLGGPFDFYGTSQTDASVATNGYIAFDNSDGGADFTNDCPLPSPVSAGAGARIAALHDDLVAGSVFHQSFPTCPRAGDTGSSGGCDIIQWTQMDYFEGGGSADFQAVLYHDSNEIVMQFLSGNPRMGSSQTVGIQNANGTDGLTFACETPGSITDNSAVCFFHPSATAPEFSDAGLILTAPVLTIDSLATGNTASVTVDVEIPADFSCGNQFALDYLGTAYDGGFSNNGQSSVVSVATSGCNKSSPPAVSPRGQAMTLKDGFWFNALRGGNGIDLHYIGDQMYSAWFTAEPGRVPVWYYVQTLGEQKRLGNQFRASILRFTNDGNSTNIVPVASVVGEAVFSFLSSSTAVMTWTINGVSNGEKLVFFDIDAGAVDDVITDQWFNPSEAGWGLGVHRQGGQEFNAVYLYGTDGEPRWVVTIENPLSNASVGVAAFEAHCPGCAYIAPTLIPAGNFTGVFNNDGTGMLDLEIDVAGDEPIQWSRDDLPLIEINPPSVKLKQP